MNVVCAIERLVPLNGVTFGVLLLVVLCWAWAVERRRHRDAETEHRIAERYRFTNEEDRGPWAA